MGEAKRRAEREAHREGPVDHTSRVVSETETRLVLECAGPSVIPTEEVEAAMERFEKRMADAGKRVRFSVEIIDA